MSHVVLVGPMGSGKTTLGIRLAKELGRDLVDSDAVVAARTGRTAREIAETEGVATLHDLEREIFLQAVAEPEPSVIAPAASIIEDPESREALDGCVCVYLRADPDILSKRSVGSDHRRPIAPSEHVDDRTPLFEHASDLEIDTGLVPEDEAIARIVAALDRGPG